MYKCSKHHPSVFLNTLDQIWLFFFRRAAQKVLESTSLYSILQYKPYLGKRIVANGERHGNLRSYAMTNIFRYTDMVNELATLGDDPNHLNEFGEAPLCVAAFKG